MIRQQAFGGSAKLLKGALHSHTTRSDGKTTPEETLRLYASMQYDFVALTDHNIYNYKNFAPDVAITIIPGMERDHSLPGVGVHCFHTVCLGPSAENGNGYKQDQRFIGRQLVQNAAEYQPVLDDIHAHGNITIYCHPQWSGTPTREFEALKGNFAMEIWNTGCALDNQLDMDADYWDEMLSLGHKLYGVAVDDGHFAEHHGHGYVMVNAENNIEAILKALVDGAFYSSCGPVIRDFYVENGVAVLECEGAASIGFRHMHVPTKRFFGKNGPITRAEWKVPEGLSYVRGIVEDEKGRKAFTNPIFL